MGSRFQWVVCQLDQLLDHPQTESFGDDEIDEVLRTLPQSLTDTYDRILERIPNGTRKDNAYRLLQFLLFRRRPIQVLVANEFLSVKCSGFNVSMRIKYPCEITRDCSSLVTIRGTHSENNVDESTEIFLAHPSVRDYLLFNRTPGEGQVKLFGQLEANEAIFKTCLHYIYFLSTSDADPCSQDLHDKFPLASYAGRHLFAHASAARNDEETVDEETVKAAIALYRNKDAFRTWVCHRSSETAWQFRHWRALSHALMEKVMKASAWYTAARYGLKDCLKALIEHKSYHVYMIKSVKRPFGFWKTGDQPKGNMFLKTFQSLILDHSSNKTDQSLILDDSLVEKTYQSISPLYIAAESGHEDVVRMLIKAGFILDEIGGPRGTALEVACANNYVGVVEALLKNVNYRVITTVWFRRALMVAVRMGSLQLIQVFLKHGFFLWRRYIEPAIFNAALYGNTAVVEELLRYSHPLLIDHDPLPPGWLSTKMLDVFCWFSGATYDQYSTAQLLESYNKSSDQMLKQKHFEKVLGNPSNRAHLFSTKLQVAAFEGHEKIVEALLKRGWRPNATGGYFGTALQAAAARGSPGVVQRLLDAGANPNTTGGFFKTALNASLMTARWTTEDRHSDPKMNLVTRDRFRNRRRDRHKDPVNYEAVLVALLKAGARPYRGAQEPRCALELGNQEAALNIIENAVSGAEQAAGDFHTVATLLRGEDVADSAPLYDAISQGFSRVVKSMICNGAAMDVINSCGRTPLHCAMRQNNQAVALMVIQAVGQRPDAASLTAVHYAAQLPVSYRTMNLLLDLAIKAGIFIECLDARNRSGQTALHYAPHNASDSTSRMVQLLIEAAASASNRTSSAAQPLRRSQ